MLAHDQIIGRLEAIEQDLADRQVEFERAAEERHRLARDYELRLARATLVAQGSTATEKKANALVAVAAADDDVYDRFMGAEGSYEGLRAAVRVLEQRATIGMSLLKASIRETPDVQPAWSAGRAA